MKYYYVVARALCPFCNEIIKELKTRQKNFLYCQVDDSPDLLAALKRKYKWQTVPIVILKDTNSDEEQFIGGCQDTKAYLKTTE